MAAPTTPTNLDLIHACIEQVFKSVSHENGYRTKRFLVLRGKDPRQQKGTPEYRELLNAVSFKMRSRIRNSQLSIGSRITWDCQMDVWALGTVVDGKDQETLDEVESRIQDDLWRALASDTGLVQAAQQLDLSAPPNIIGLQVSQFVSSNLAAWPDTHSVAHISFRFFETKPQNA